MAMCTILLIDLLSSLALVAPELNIRIFLADRNSVN
jgi:hypothetical protein